MTHIHDAWAEKDEDGMWEPSCFTCGVLAGPPFNAVCDRYPTKSEAVSAAAAIMAMLPQGEED